MPHVSEDYARWIAGGLAVLMTVSLGLLMAYAWYSDRATEAEPAQAEASPPPDRPPEPPIAEVPVYTPRETFEPEASLRERLDALPEPAQPYEPVEQFGSSGTYGQIARSVGLLEIDLVGVDDGQRGRMTCTATLVADDLLLTNYHCLPGSDSTRQAVRARLYLDVLRAADTPVVFPVAVQPEEGDAELDYALVHVGGAPGRRYGTVALTAREVGADEALLVVHHPGGDVLQLSRGCTLIAFEYPVPAPDLLHSCAVEPGSSGSLLFAADGAAVGLNRGGYQRRAGVATQASALLEHSALLRRLARGESVTPTQPIPGQKR